jgi:isopenicillin N synthase-like dioxygenase
MINFAMSAHTVKIPVINLEQLLREDCSTASMAIIAAELDKACKSHGVFYLQGHGIETGDVLSAMKQFFALPQALKKSLAVKAEGISRGYIGMGEESGSEMLEVKEAFSYGFPLPEEQLPSNALQGHNVWPAETDIGKAWKPLMLSFYDKMCDIALALARGFSIAAGEKAEYLGSFCEGGETISMMRLFHYLPYQAAEGRFSDNKARVGSSPHTDWGFLTLILQEDAVPGLQLYLNDEWHDIEPLPGALVVNCGDYFSLLTGGKYISPVHRVISSGNERLSSVLFFYPAYDAKIPLMGQQQYSLFTDQQPGGVTINKHELPEKSFGEFIAEKWRQVKRQA